LKNIINKLFFLVVLTLIFACSTLQNAPSKPELKVEKPKKTSKKLPPLFQEGTKPLLNQDPEAFTPAINGTDPCVNSETGKEQRFLLADLKSELIPLSYSNMDRVVASLQVMGVKTIVAAIPTTAPYTVDTRGKATYLPAPTQTTAELRKDYSCSDLPIFYKPKSAPVNSLSQVLEGPGTRGQVTGSRFSFVDMKSADYGLNESLVVFYHPEGQKRLDNIKKNLNETFDASPVQIYIESMVLEVNESGFEELGVLYKSNKPKGFLGNEQSKFQVGATAAQSPSAAETAAASSAFFQALVEKGSGATSVQDLLSIQIAALVAKGSAEVLSRPSVIALNNRPAIIEVTEQKQFPIRSTSQYGTSTTNILYSFEEVTPGILLQIRPRVSDQKNEVSMEIDVQVKALVSANDGEAKNDSAVVIATKPGSSTRRVHTFAIVPNKTPIIIGGLVSRDTEDVTNKIPFLGSIPYLGKLFGAESSKREKKEVIVVITPHIIRDTKKPGIQTPKDTDMFDDTGMDLFHDSYRVRTEDVFDLGFVYKAEPFKKYRNYVVSRSSKDKAFARTKLAKSYVGEQFPGGDALVVRMIYDIVGKRKLENAVSGERIIVTEHAGDGKFEKVTFLKKAWEKAKSKSLPTKDGKSKQDFGLELKFSGKEASSSVKPHVALRILPKAEIALLSETSKYDNKPNRIFIASEKDLKKIRKAIVVREILTLNRNEHIDGSLNEFHTGTKLVLPVIERTRHFLLDLDVATAYHQSKYYYPILEKSLRESFRSIEKKIEKESNS
jgi:general secretion pathway protein D